MANQKITSAPGNRVSLRSRPQNQVHQIPFLVNLMGPLADVLTTTWGGILMGIATLAGGGFILFNYITGNGMHCDSRYSGDDFINYRNLANCG